MAKKKLIPNTRNFKEDMFKTITFVLLFAWLLTIKPIAKFVGNLIGQPWEVVQNFGLSVALIATGMLLTLVAGIIAIASIKFIVAAAGLALIAWGGFTLYNMFTGNPAQSLMPAWLGGEKKK